MPFQDHVKNMLEVTPMPSATMRRFYAVTTISAHMSLDAQHDALKEKLGRSAFTDDYTREERIEMRASLAALSAMHHIKQSQKLC